MFLSFWDEYLGFILIFAGTILLIVLVYWLMTRPKVEYVEEDMPEENQEPEEDGIHTTEYVVAEKEPVAETDKHEEMPEIITYMPDSHEEEEESDEISSNLNEEDEEEEEEIHEVLKEEPKKKVEKVNENPTVRLNISYQDKRKMSVADKSGPDIQEEIHRQIKREEEMEDKDPSRRYHVLFLKDEGTWYVKREGNDEIVKILLTQKEAIAYATIWALRNDTSVVVHRKDGVIRRHTL